MADLGVAAADRLLSYHHRPYRRCCPSGAQCSPALTADQPKPRASRAALTALANRRAPRSRRLLHRDPWAPDAPKRTDPPRPPARLACGHHRNVGLPVATRNRIDRDYDTVSEWLLH